MDGRSIADPLATVTASAKHVHASGTTLRAWHCRNCGREFEGVDDGTVGYGPPCRIS